MTAFALGAGAAQKVQPADSSSKKCEQASSSQTDQPNIRREPELSQSTW